MLKLWMYQKFAIILWVFLSILFIWINPYITISFLVFLIFLYFNELSIFFGKYDESFKEKHPIMSYFIFGIILFFIWYPNIANISPTYYFWGSSKLLPQIGFIFKIIFYIIIFIIFTPFLSDLIKDIFNSLFGKKWVRLCIFLLFIFIILCLYLYTRGELFDIIWNKWNRFIYSL